MNINRWRNFFFNIVQLQVLDLRIHIRLSNNTYTDTNNSSISNTFSFSLRVKKWVQTETQVSNSKTIWTSIWAKT